MLGILGGLILLLLGIMGLACWWPLLVAGLKAIIPVLLIAGGVVAIIAGIKANKEEAQAEEKVSQEDSEKKYEKDNEE
ncbi:MAG: hypothetical protein KAX15_06980 [Candidatus Omnitrophica bacterium]|nr:hypothetical protein [Candidatus Omnitrophota bacterium]